jgi:hypothetical protein
VVAQVVITDVAHPVHLGSLASSQAKIAVDVLYLDTTAAMYV